MNGVGVLMTTWERPTAASPRTASAVEKCMILDRVIVLDEIVFLVFLEKGVVVVLCAGGLRSEIRRVLFSKGCMKECLRAAPGI